MVKNLLSLCGGEDVGWDVSALSSHCRTEILKDRDICVTDQILKWADG